MECINDYLSFASENLDYRKARGRNLPLFLWEPVPDLCTPDNASAMLNVLPHVDAMSPNHLELMRFYHQEELAEYHKEVEGKIVEDGGDSSDEATEEKALLEYIVKSLIYRLAKPTMVVRCSSWGCLISRWDPQHGTVVATWLPAFYEPVEGLGNHPKVVDPTGGGNAFIGGLAINLVQQQKEQEERGIEHPVLDFVQAAAHGNITASFAIEQVGVPKMEVTADGGEMWNGEVVETRLRRYLERCGL